MPDEFIEFHPLEKMADKNPADFLAFLEAHLQEQGVDYAVELLRLSGICVDIYGTGKYSRLLKASLNLLKSHNGQENKSLNKLTHDIDLFEALFKSFRDLRANTGITTVSLDHQIPAFLLAAEIFLGSLTAYADNKSKGDISKIYPFVVGFGDSNENLAMPKMVFPQMVDLFDSVTEHLGQILKYLYFTGASSVGLNQSISIAEIVASRDHIYLFDGYDAISKANEYWRFWGGKIISLDKLTIHFSPISEKDFTSQKIGSFRSRIRRNSWMQSYSLIKDKISVSPHTKQLPKREYRLPVEYLSANFCYDYFGSEDLSEQISSISLAEWIRAYTILNQVSSLFLEERKSMKPFILQEWCIAKTEHEWISIFETNGINAEKAQTIVKILTFDKTAKDLIDCPLIPIEGFLVLMPTLGNNISAADAMLSNFMHKKLDAGFRGKGLENRIIGMLNKQGIQGKNIKSRIQNEEYECDVVFVLEDHLFFLECKAFLQPDSPRTYYELIDKMIDAAAQLKRISSFYEENLGFVKEKLNLPNTWRPIQTHNIVVTSALVGESILIDGCYITDESNIKRFVDREAPGIAIGHVMLPIPNKDYDGIITVEKLMHVISDPSPISIVKAMMSKEDIKIELNNLIFIYDDLQGQGSHYLSRKRMKKIAKFLKVSENYLRKKIKGH